MSRMFDIEGVLVAHEEKRAWIMLIVALVVYPVYVVIVLRNAAGGPLVDVPYASTLLWSIGIAIVAHIALDIATSIGTPRAERTKDVRDREIARVGDATGQAFLVIGALAALALALVEADQFWIANVIYLGFVLSAVLGSLTKIAGYREAFQTW
jgi:hypothetical protein